MHPRGPALWLGRFINFNSGSSRALRGSTRAMITPTSGIARNDASPPG
jgi:hypothetical protein